MAGIALVAAVGLGHTPLARADLSIPANAVLALNGATIDLACTDLIIAGTLQIGTGSVINVRHVSIQGGALIDGGSGTIALGGNWSNAGTLVPGTGSVRFRDLCSLASATVTGNTAFSTASFVSAIGKTYVFAVGSTQTVSGLLEIAGTAGQPIRFRSGTPGQVANLDLGNAGTQQIQHVGVTDVWATGQWLAPGLSNEGGGGNAQRWFGSGPNAPQVIPTLGDHALAALTMLLAVIGAWQLRRSPARASGRRRSRQRTRG